MERTEKRRLLEEFPEHTLEQWKEAAVQLLKGRPFDKTLITQTYEGFDLQPIYMQETLPELSHLGDQPGMGTMVRGARVDGYLENSWLISQELSAPSPDQLNGVIREGLENGQNEVNIWLDRPSRSGLGCSSGDESTGVCGVSLSSVEDLRTAFKGVHADMVSFYLQSGMAAPAVYALFAAWVGETPGGGADIRGCIGLDPIAWLAENGQFPGERDRVFATMSAMLKSSKETLPQLQVIEAAGHSCHNAGGSSVQEMAMVLASGVTYLREMCERGHTAAEVASRMRLTVSVGGNFFLEVAKLRALRLLWQRVLSAWGVSEKEQVMHVHARTGLWNKTILDPYVNMLRTTTEAFSAVVGGCDSLHVSAFDEIIRESDTFSRRIARNTHTILAEECGMSEVIDPAGGSWAVETLTDQMAREAWSAFQKIEEAGGIIASLQTGSLQAAVGEVRAQRLRNIERRKDSIVGTNVYPNATEKLLEPRDMNYRAVRKELMDACEKRMQERDQTAVKELLTGADSAETLEPLVAAAASGATLDELMGALKLGEPDVSATSFKLIRAAGAYENLRLSARAFTASGKDAILHQLNIGPSRRYRARADWTSAFFQAGGFTVLNADDYESTEEATAALSQSGARIAVITSDDETYAAMAGPVARAIKEQDAGIRVILAGAPGENESELRAAGVDDFVHVRVNNYTFNRDLLKLLGAPVES